MNWLQIVRLVLFIFTFLCAIIVVGIAGDLTSISETYLGGYFVFAVLGIATAVLTILTLPAMIIIDYFRNGAFTSMIVVELSWLSVLWILWLAAGATAANSLSTYFGTCLYINDIINKGCHESQAIEAFVWLAWITLFGYTVLLLVMSIVKMTRGKNVWFSSIKEAFAPEAEQFTVEPKVGAPVVQNSYPPQSALAPISEPSPYHQV
ncbi:hypothetical protein B0H21DRAFT_348128 [Amylocystis lapponica]|nr:hypothetical protein B0H21DRAFT_348128 [Amylocystis lapponica]